MWPVIKSSLNCGLFFIEKTLFPGGVGGGKIIVTRKHL